MNDATVITDAGAIVSLACPVGQALVLVTVTETCAEADELRASVTGPALVCCRCHLVRALLAAAGPDEADLIQRFALALNPGIGAIQ